MKNTFISIGIIFVVLIAGCTQQNATPPANNSNADVQKECGTDVDCFQQTALNNCGKTSLIATSSISGLFGIDSTYKLKYESRGKEGNQCIFYQKWISIEPSFPSDTQLTQEQKDQMISNMKQFEGKEVICKLNKSEFDTYIQKMAGFIKTGSGSFSSDDLPSDKCTGSFYEISQYEFT